MARGLYFALLCLAIAFLTRSLARTYFSNPPTTLDHPMPQTANFAKATGKTDIFYYDLGGTLCMCEWKWSVAEYWSKVMSGFAFNFAHVIGTFEFYVLTGRTKVIVIAVFVNEMIEELWLTSGYWGFTLDPPMDMEARYDSLIRDTMCCFLGIMLARNFCRVFKVKPMIKLPVTLDWNPNNPHSVHRFIKFAIQGITLWQITLIYNADLGPFHFNPANMMLLISYDSVIAVICFWNLGDFPSCSRRHVISWHLGWAAFSTYIFLFTVYPTFESAMYLIIVVECSASIALYWIELAIRSGWHDIDLVIFGAPKRDGGSHAAHEDLQEQGDKEPSFPIDSYRQALIHLEKIGAETVTLEDLRETVLESNYRAPKARPLRPRVEVLRAILKSLVRMIIVAVAWNQPFLWQGTQYRRHWCGNPLVKGYNGCEKYHNL